MKKYKRPIIVCSTGGKFSENLNRRLIKNGITVLPSPERAVKTIAALYRYWKYLTS
jgi:acyl-CoA synthetase (NDP forming)